MLQYSLNMAFPGFSIVVVVLAFISAFLLCELIAHLESWIFIFAGPSLISRGYKKVWCHPSFYLIQSLPSFMFFRTDRKRLKEALL